MHLFPDFHNGIRSCDLFAVDAKPLTQAGEMDLTLSFDTLPNHKFVHTFILADISHPILGLDFLHNNHIIIDTHSYQRWSRGHKARGQGQGQGHKKNPRPRPRPRTAFPRTDTLEAKDRNARGQGQGPRTQSASALQKKKKKKGLHKNFSGDLQKKKKKKKKKKVFTKIFQAISTKKRFPKNFSTAPQNFNFPKNSAVLEPRTGQFSRT